MSNAPQFPQTTPNWWKAGIMYQVYPRSFQDTTGDGVGDLRGITQRLDHLQALGIDLLWLGPIFQSPNDDNGYDISDYEAIMPEFGTLSDFEALLAAAHRRGIRVLLDLVVNHSSDEHRWFAASKHPDSPYRDYYYWREEKPTNWPSFFGGDAWTYDAEGQGWYLHLFSKKQPDLNWENPALRQEIYRMMRFWLDKGVDGFRMDVIPFISKRLDWPEVDPSDFGQLMAHTYANGPRVHEFLREMHEEVLQHYDLTTVGEAPGVSPELAPLYVGAERRELSMLFHFGHMTIDWGPGGRFDVSTFTLSDFKRVFTTWYEALLPGDGWLNIFLDNHDYARLVSRFGDDERYRVESAKLLALLLFTQRGTPCIYQGSEIGMTNTHYPHFDHFRDLETLNALAERREQGGDLEALLRAVNVAGRDNARTPMQWDDSAHAGFTTGEPWIPVNPNYPHINVAAAEADPDSVLYWYRELIAWRRATPTLVYGAYEDLLPEDEQLFVYRRWDEVQTFYVVLNFGATERNLPGVLPRELALVKSNYRQPEGRLAAWEARVYTLSVR